MKILGKIIGTIIGEFIIWWMIALVVWLFSLMFNFEWRSETVWGIWAIVAVFDILLTIGKWVDD